MSTYAFRITCKLAGNNFAIKENTPLVLPAPTPPIQVMLGKSKDQTEGWTLILQGGGFSSEEEARAAGIPVKTAVMLAGLLLGVGIDVGTDQVLSPASQHTDSQPIEHWQPDVHGLQVVPELDRLAFGFVYFGRPILKRPISNSNLEEKVTEEIPMAMERQLVVRMDARVYDRLRRRAAELSLSLSDYARLMACFEFPYDLVCADVGKILDAQPDQAGEQYLPVLTHVLARIAQGKQDLSPLVEALVEAFPAQQQASKDVLARVEQEVRDRLEQFQVLAQGIREIRKHLPFEHGVEEG
jgi:hypothetical protein